jgi:hypothetical protein
MEIQHRITFGHKDDVDDTIENMGLDYKTSPLPGGGYLIHIDTSESDDRWQEIAALARQKNALDMFDTIFTGEEILTAEWLRLVPVFEQGYPQPQETWTRAHVNYADHCSQCGTYRQVESFRIKKEPNLGKNDFMSLYWTYALFCTPRVVEQLQSHHLEGYEVWDVVLHRREVRSEKVVQLFIPGVADPALVRADDLQREVCPLCHVTKYYPHMRGVMYLKRDALLPGVDLMQTYEWFGSGHSAYREIIVSNRFARLILEQGWKGVRMKVVEAV